VGLDYRESGVCQLAELGVCLPMYYKGMVDWVLHLFLAIDWSKWKSDGPSVSLCCKISVS
jgi:hypothetical protein